MAQHEDPRMTTESALDAWPDLAPNPEAMAQITALMMAGMADRQRKAATTAATVASGESQFRLLSYIWAAITLGIYLAWDLLAAWLQMHPAWMALLIAFACVSLLAPLVLLPILSAIDEGGTSPC